MTSEDSLIESARPISEAEARIEAALKVAFRATSDARDQQSTSNALALITLATALSNIIDILSDGRPKS